MKEEGQVAIEVGEFPMGDDLQCMLNPNVPDSERKKKVAWAEMAKF